MITQTQILRMIEAQEFAQLVARLITNGRCHSRVARDLLIGEGAAGPAALGLALQRLCEITYWPTPDAASVAHRLARMQRRDGSFGAGSDDLVAAVTAVALRGLTDWIAQHRGLRSTDTRTGHDQLTIISKGVTRAWEALQRAWREASPSGKHNQPAWAIVLWQLGDCDEAREHLPIPEMRRAIRSSSAVLLQDDLSRLALTMAA